MKPLWMVALWCSLAACGASQSSCPPMVEAARACETEATGAPITDAAYCDAFANQTGKVANASAAFFACQLEAYNAGDCATTDGYTTLIGELDACRAEAAQAE
jgi:hypothetical protein